MYTYKFVNVKHSAWTGKPKESIEDIINTHALDGWRFVQVVIDSASVWYKGYYQTKVIFEKTVAVYQEDTGHYREADLI